MKNQSPGGAPIKGNISDRQISIILEIPPQTLRDWAVAGGYRTTLYWMLKTMKKDELAALKEKARETMLSS